MDVFKLSRNWFDWCFENPEKINSNHSAMYFFIIEHCNRLGWKEKFGLPTEMTKDAIGIKNYRTFSNTFNDLANWGFIKVIQKSTNQYSSNIIAIVENTKANTKALDKALQKQRQKQVHGIVCIDIQETNKPINLLTESAKKTTWRDSFEIYLNELRESYTKIKNDKDWIKGQEKYYPDVDIEKSIEKSCVNYWSTEEGWSAKLKKQTTSINWKKTLSDTIKYHKVYYGKNGKLTEAAKPLKTHKPLTEVYKELLKPEYR